VPVHVQNVSAESNATGRVCVGADLDYEAMMKWRIDC